MSDMDASMKMNGAAAINLINTLGIATTELARCSRRHDELSDYLVKRLDMMESELVQLRQENAELRDLAGRIQGARMNEKLALVTEAQEEEVSR